jgi:hypothetical protein
MTLIQIADLTDIQVGDTLEIETATGTTIRVVSDIVGSTVLTKKATKSKSSVYQFTGGALRNDNGLTWQSSPSAPVVPVVSLWRSA